LRAGRDFAYHLDARKNAKHASSRNPNKEGKVKRLNSRRAWFKGMAAGLGGLLAAERKGHAANADYAMIDPKDAIKITKLEIIPVHSQRSLFLKMHTGAGIVGIGEGTV